MRFQNATVAVERKALRRWPSTFAGAWHTAGENEFTLAFTKNSDANVAELQSEFPYPDTLRAERRELSVVAASAILDEAIADRHEIQRGRSNASASMRQTKGRYNLANDVINGRLVAFVDNEPPGFERALRDRYHPQFETRSGAGGPACHTRSDCHPSMRGGLALDPECTSGFTASGASGRRFVLTAGHCIADGTAVTWSSGGFSYGRNDRQDRSGNVDALRVPNESTTWGDNGVIGLSPTTSAPSTTGSATPTSNSTSKSARPARSPA